MGILGIVMHTALAIGGICTGITHGKQVFDGVKADLEAKNTVEPQNDQEPKAEE